MNDIEKVIDLINKKTKLVAMIAPSFPIMFEPSVLIDKLKQIGFSYVVEVAVGAKKTNEGVIELFTEHPESRYITSPCASFTRFIRTKHPEFLPYLVFKKVDSLMIAITRIVKEKYPDYQPIFIGPCIVKKLEAKDDYPELGIIVITYKELLTIFEKLNISNPEGYQNETFDMIEPSTRIYPTDGGLTNSSGVRKLLLQDEIRIVSGWQNCENALIEFKENPKIKLLDILFCEGGCINGPGVLSTLSIDERKNKIREYATQQ
ncbi:MAG: [Fe-Fe] hydrogenase large subunit C-terminal domain-containing protein [bacterium]|nr:[Fe-Fe] hydrogenase large subunit C-terminal domain-containing protein [bacterium]